MDGQKEGELDEFCKIVAEDRRDNAETASDNRLGETPEQTAQSSDEDDDDNGGLNSDYF